jgi:hypothetical protein
MTSQELIQVTNSTEQIIRVSVVLRYTTHLISKENTISHIKTLSLVPSLDKLTTMAALYKDINPDETVEIFKPEKTLSGFSATLQLKAVMAFADENVTELFHDLGKFNQFVVYPEKIEAKVSLDVLRPDESGIESGPLRGGVKKTVIFKTQK